jgi:hypothetical protein
VLGAKAVGDGPRVGDVALVVRVAVVPVGRSEHLAQDLDREPGALGDVLEAEVGVAGHALAHVPEGGDPHARGVYT